MHDDKSNLIWWTLYEWVDFSLKMDLQCHLFPLQCSDVMAMRGPYSINTQEKKREMSLTVVFLVPLYQLNTYNVPIVVLYCTRSFFWIHQGQLRYRLIHLWLMIAVVIMEPWGIQLKAYWKGLKHNIKFITKKSTIGFWVEELCALFSGGRCHWTWWGC